MPPITVYLLPHNMVAAHIRGELYAWHYEDRWQLFRSLVRCVVNERLDFTVNDCLAIQSAVCELASARIAE